MKKNRLKEFLRAELDAVSAKAPHIKVVKLGDGAKDNWEFISKNLPEGSRSWTSTTRLNTWTTRLPRSMATARRRHDVAFKTCGHVLRHHEDGLESVIRSLAYLAKKHPERTRVAQVLGCFRRNRRRMTYAGFATARLPIGSGFIEAACKTLATERLKRSSMSWSQEGGQAILTADSTDAERPLRSRQGAPLRRVQGRHHDPQGGHRRGWTPPRKKPNFGATAIPFPQGGFTSE